MRFSYKFANVLGSVYDRGNLVFFPDGNRLLSPCGNKIVMYDLKNGKSEALSFEIQYNVDRMALNPTSSLLLVATEKCQLLMASMISGTVLHRKDFKDIGAKIYDMQFSPDGRYYAICGANRVLVYLTPGFVFKGTGRQLSPFKIHKMIKASHDESTAISWNDTSQLLIITSRDFSMKIYPIDRTLAGLTNFITLTAHNDLIVGAFFANDRLNPLNLYSISRNGQLFCWEANYSTMQQLIAPRDETEPTVEGEKPETLNYSLGTKKYIFEDLKDKNSVTRVTNYSYHSTTKFLVVGFNHGAFLLYELPEATLIHSLQLSTKGPIEGIAFNSTGHWIAIGAGVGRSTKYDVDSDVTTQTQLIVWEWQSESFILKQSGYSSGVTNSYECLSYSPDASMMITGGTDGRIKVWSVFSGFCVSTFATEHKGPVTAVEFVSGKNGKVFVTASLDGTVKAFDLNRYRCFRTLSGPNESKPAQFISVAVDKIGGDFIAAGSHNFFEIFLWSMKTGRLLETLTGHEGPVSAVKFSPINNTLYSCSWDANVRVWSLFEGAKHSREVVKLGADALDLAIREDGQEFAVATLNGNITFFDANSCHQLGVGIEGRKDLGTVRYKKDEVNDKYRYFSTIAYSVDGEYIIAGGKAKSVCIYNVRGSMLVKKIIISNNLSLDGFDEFVSKRKRQEFGFNLAVIKYREDNAGLAPISLPGVLKSDYADREMAPIVAVHGIRFSPTMRTFAFASTEGVIIYSLDKANIFDPYELEAGVTPATMRRSLVEENYSEALMQALKLNNQPLVIEVVESIPVEQIQLVTVSLPINYVELFLGHLAKALESTVHIEFYMKWIGFLLRQHGNVLKTHMASDKVSSTLRYLQQNVSRYYQSLTKICDHNKYMIKFIGLLAKHSPVEAMEGIEDEEEEEDEEEDETVGIEKIIM